MQIQRNPILAPQLNVEQLVNTQKQEYPKPSIPPEENQSPIRKEFNPAINEGKNYLEADLKNASQDKKEEEMNFKPSLNNFQSLALKASTVKSQIEAYKSGSDNDEQLNIQSTQDYIKEFRDLQHINTQASGIDSYKQNSLLQ